MNKCPMTAEKTQHLVKASLNRIYAACNLSANASVDIFALCCFLVQAVSSEVLHIVLNYQRSQLCSAVLSIKCCILTGMHKSTRRCTCESTHTIQYSKHFPESNLLCLTFTLRAVRVRGAEPHPNPIPDPSPSPLTPWCM